MNPSDWQREMATTSSERHDQIRKFVFTRFLKEEYKPPSEVMVRPSFLIFQNWKGASAIKLDFSIVNKSKVCKTLH